MYIKIGDKKVFVNLIASPPNVDRIWGICGSYFNIPKAIFYLLTGDYIT